MGFGFFGVGVIQLWSSELSGVAAPRVDRRSVKLGGVAKEPHEAQHYQSGGRPNPALPLPFAGAFER